MRIRLVTLAACIWLVPSALQAQGRGRSVLELLEPIGALTLGETVESALSSSDYRSSQDTYMEAWTFAGRAGASATFDMISDDVDALLLIVGPGLETTRVDDDGGGGCHARLTVTFLEDGTFHVIASSALTREAGVYTLRVTEQPEPAPRYSCGGVNPAVLTGLDTADRVLRVGDEAISILTPSADEIIDGRGGEAWALEGREGESASVTLESDAFDAYLLITGPGLTDVLSDDDGAGGLNSQINLTFPATATYTVVASTIDQGGVGPYRLTVKRPLDLNELDTAGRTLAPGEEMEGRLTADDPIIGSGRHGQAWALEGRAGQRYTIELDSSHFDTYLIVVGPGLEEPRVDDDSGGNLDSRLSIVLPADGLYRIVVTSAGANETGAFRLRVLPD